jgi:hypothetical protein
MSGSFAGLYKIPRSKLIRQSDHRRTHGSIFMRTLRPRHSLFGIDPNGESHALRPFCEKNLRFYGLVVAHYFN